MYIDRGRKNRKSNITNVIFLLIALAVAFILGVFMGRIGYEKKEKEQSKSRNSSEDSLTEDISSEHISDEDQSTDIVSSEGSSAETIQNTEENSSTENSTDELPDDMVNTGYMEDFSDAVFIGDSRTQAFMIGAGLGNSHFYCEKGINVSSAMTDAVFTLPDGNKGNLRDALSGQQFTRVYVMFGANELGWPDPKEFGAKYSEVIRIIQELQPQAKIYVQSILPVSKDRTAWGDYVNNVQIATFNEVIFQMTVDTGTTFLPVGAALADEAGCLPEDASVDGVHPNQTYCMRWLEYLRQNP